MANPTHSHPELVSGSDLDNRETLKQVQDDNNKVVYNQKYGALSWQI